MITRIEPASNSTQLSQLAMDTVIREFADMAQLPIARLQRSLENPNSPIRSFYVTLMHFLKADANLQEKFKQLNAWKTQLESRRKSVQKRLVQLNNPELAPAFKSEFEQQTALEKQIDALSYKFQRIQNKLKALNAERLRRFKTYMHQYEQNRDALETILHDNGYARFTDAELNNAFSKLCHITDNEEDPDERV